jgi:hypothetical protein
MKKLITILFICLLQNSYGQTTYYVSWSDIAANDANNGTSPSTPWKTLRKAETATLNPGDKILFKRNDVWHFDNEVSYFDGFDVLNSGTSGNPITYGAYGTGARPRFVDRQTIPGWTVSSNWISRGGNRWAIYISGLQPLSANYRCRVWADSVELACPDPASATPTAVTSIKRFALSTDSLYIYSTTNPATTFTTMQKSNGNKRQGFKIGGVNYIKVSNIDVSTSSTTSFVVYNSNNINIDSCNAGYDGVFSPIVVFSSNTGTISNTMINSGYKIDNQFQFNGPEDGISLEQGTTNWDVYKDTMINMIHSGFGFDYSTSDIITNNSVHDCYISTPDVAYGRGFTINTNTGSYGNKVYNNKIINTRTSNQISGPGADVYNNIIDLVTKPTYRASTDRSGAAIAIISYNSTDIRNVNIFNNTITHAQNMAFDIEGRLSDDGTREDSIVDTKIINNIIYENATGGQETNPYQIYLLDDNPYVKRLTIRNNIIYKSGASILIYYSPNDVNSGWPKTVAQFNATDGAYENTINGNINADPLLNSDYSLQAGSPAIEAGIDVGLPFTGSAPDIGAVAYTNIAAPTLSLSGNQNITVSSTTIYATPGWASGHSGTVSWTKISGPGATTITPSGYNATVSNLQTGTYVFRCTATQDDSQSAYAEVTIDVSIPIVITPSSNKLILRTKKKLINN